MPESKPSRWDRPGTGNVLVIHTDSASSSEGSVLEVQPTAGSNILPSISSVQI